MEERKFVNPYHFISFPKTKAPGYTDEDRHTGMIQYTITTKTPLFIPNSSSDTAFKFEEAEKVRTEKQYHKSYDFFSYTELDEKENYEGKFHVPVVPGSEMRGVIRSVYETLTDSCMGVLNEDEYPIKRTAEAFQPALLYRKKGKTGERMVLYDAYSFRIGEKAEETTAEETKLPPGFEECKNGTEIYYRKPKADGKKGWKAISEYSIGNEGKKEEYSNSGYLLKWGMGLKKGRYHVFTQKIKNERKNTISKDKVERELFRVIDSYLEQPAVSPENKKAYEEYRDNLSEFLKGEAGEYFPVTYSLISNSILYLAPSIFSKEVSNNSVGALAGVFSPCKKNHCPACQLFGYIGESNETSSGSKIRFTDLYVSEQSKKEKPEDYYLCDRITLETLGGPKLGNVDFYLKRPKHATFWTYDYYVQNGVVKEQPGQLRGRKYYWHHQEVHLPENVKVSVLNKTVRPVKDKVSFTGKIYFEGISETQLNQLIWILNSGTENLGFKLGSGKPLGLGSISCNVDLVQERIIKLEKDILSYETDESKTEKISELNYENVGFSESVKDEFYKIARFDTIPKGVQITYPRTEEQKDGPLEEGYRWFVANHGGTKMKNKRIEMKIIEPLPDITKETQFPALGLSYEVVDSQPEKQNEEKNQKGKKGQNTGKGKNDNREKKHEEKFTNNPFANLCFSEDGTLQVKKEERKNTKRKK